jgi:hypothetical protein
MTVLPRSGVKDRARERKAAQMENLDVLDAIQARADKATPGWTVYDQGEDDGPEYGCHIKSSDADADWVAQNIYNRTDAAFIAAAREDVPRLVRALRAALAGLGECEYGGCPAKEQCRVCSVTSEALAELGEK